MSRFDLPSVVPSSLPRNQKINELAKKRDRLHELFRQIHSAAEQPVRELATCEALVIMGDSACRHTNVPHKGVKKVIGQRLASMLQGDRSDQELARKVLKTYGELQVFTTSGFLTSAK